MIDLADPVERGRPDRVAPRRLRRAASTVRAFLSESRLNLLGTAIVVLVLLLAVFGPLIAPYGPDQTDLLAVLQGPTSHHWFGTDNIGRDVYSRVIVGARISIEVAVIILSLSVTFGTIVGVLSGLVGGLVDELIMRATDLFLAFPGFILAAAIAATLGPSLQHTVLALAVVFWPWYTRLTRGQVLSLREREFVQAARVMGVPTRQILFKELLPNMVAPIVVSFSTREPAAFVSRVPHGKPRGSSAERKAKQQP